MANYYLLLVVQIVGSNTANYHEFIIQFSLNKSNKMQQYADINLLLNCSTYFGRPLRSKHVEQFSSI